MGAAPKKKVTKIQTSYAVKQEATEMKVERKRKLLFRRLAVFFIGVVAISFLVISTLVSQSVALEEKNIEKKKLEQELALLKKEEVALEEEIVKLNDDEYIAKLARKDYFLSEENEMIFKLPKKKEKEDKKEKSTK